MTPKIQKIMGPLTFPLSIFPAIKLKAQAKTARMARDSYIKWRRGGFLIFIRLGENGKIEVGESFNLFHSHPIGS